MTEPDEALLWARERVAADYAEDSPVMAKKILAGVSVYDSLLSRMAQAYRAGQSASAAEIAARDAEIARLRGVASQLQECLLEAAQAVERDDLGERECCDGQMCGCYGADKASFLVWNMREAAERARLALNEGGPA
jgi:hypothetical protein